MADELVKNGLPRVVWSGGAGGRKFRLVALAPGVEVGHGFNASGLRLVLETEAGADAMGAQQWRHHGVTEIDAVAALAATVMERSGGCPSCVDRGAFFPVKPDGTACAEAIPCPKCGARPAGGPVSQTNDVASKAAEPKVLLVQIRLCELCLNGAGGECHTPGCALWLRRAPDLPIMPELYEVVQVPA